MLLIGIDSGGTKTAAWLGRLEQGQVNVIGKGEAGPGNPKSVSYQTAFANLDAAIAAAFQHASIDRQAADVACFCIAGVTAPDSKHLLTDWIKNKSIAKQFRLATDVEAVLAAATQSESEPGIALIAGTGSIAWGRNEQGETARCGGWGYLLGDEGSGYSIALQAIKHICKTADGRANRSALLEAFLEELQIPDIRKLIQRVYESDFQPRDMAALSHVVFQTVDRDPAAASIIDTSSTKLADLVVSTALKLDLHRTGFQLALGGGLLVHQAGYRQSVLTKLKVTYGLDPETTVVQDPVAGSLKMAHQLASEQ